jgi:hypothetical protein
MSEENEQSIKLLEKIDKRNLEVLNNIEKMFQTYTKPSDLDNPAIKLININLDGTVYRYNYTFRILESGQLRVLTSMDEEVSKIFIILRVGQKIGNAWKYVDSIEDFYCDDYGLVYRNANNIRGFFRIVYLKYKDSTLPQTVSINEETANLF